MTAGAPAPAVYLASRSPRRRELLEQMGIRYATVNVAVDESADHGEDPAHHVERLAAAKARAGLAALGDARARVLAADTEVVIDGEVLGKPAGAAEAADMIERLSGRTHEVLTAVALAADGEVRTALSRSRVRFRDTTAAERAAYVATGEPMDKAGAYAIQGRAAVFITHLEGSYSGVMGLPVYETAELLRAAGIAPLTP